MLTSTRPLRAGGEQPLSHEGQIDNRTNRFHLIGSPLYFNGNQGLLELVFPYSHNIYRLHRAGEELNREQRRHSLDKEHSLLVFAITETDV